MNKDKILFYTPPIRIPQNCFIINDLNKSQKETIMTTKYKFQGPINFNHIVNDCLVDDKICFLAVSDNTAYFGVTRQLTFNLLDKYRNYVKPTIINKGLAFHIFEIEKRHISFTLNFMKKLPKLLATDIKMIRKRIFKDKKLGKFSNKKSTTVFVW